MRLVRAASVSAMAPSSASLARTIVSDVMAKAMTNAEKIRRPKLARTYGRERARTNRLSIPRQHLRILNVVPLALLPIAILRRGSLAAQSSHRPMGLANDCFVAQKSRQQRPSCGRRDGVSLRLPPAASTANLVRRQVSHGGFFRTWSSPLS